MPSSWYKTFMAAAGVEVGSYKPGKSKSGPPMDLANMRSNGVRALSVQCLACQHHASVNVDNQPEHLAVKSFEGRMRCSQCSSKRIDVRPDWLAKPHKVTL